MYKYHLFVYGQIEEYHNSVEGEATMRARIQFIFEEDPDAKIQIIYGENITSRTIQSSEQSVIENE